MIEARKSVTAHSNEKSLKKVDRHDSSLELFHWGQAPFDAVCYMNISFDLDVDRLAFLLETRLESFMMFWIRSWQKLECSHSAEFCPPILYRPQTLGMEGKSCKAASCIPKIA